LRVFENRVLRGYLDLRGWKWRKAGEDCIMRSFTRNYQGDYVKDGLDMEHAWKR
jgi:hypothetical protein